MDANAVSCPTIKNLLLLDADGKRIAVKYSDPEMGTVPQQLAFERSVFQKTQRTNARGEAEIIMFDNHLVVYKFVADLHFYVTGDINENEIILATMLQAFYESVSLLLRNVLEKKTVLENLDLVLLTLDELIDNGVIMETEPNVIANRVSMRGADGDTPLTEQTISQAFASAKEQLTRNLLR